MIYYEDLRKAGICVRGLKAFREQWPMGAEVTPENCVLMRHVFEFKYAAEVLLKGKQQAIFRLAASEEAKKLSAQVATIDGWYTKAISEGRVLTAVVDREAALKPLINHEAHFLAKLFAKCYNMED